MEEGIAYEVMMFSALKSLSVLVLYENNYYSTESPANRRANLGFNLSKIIDGIGLKYKKIDGNNIADMYFIALKL